MKDLYKELTGEQIGALLHLRGSIEMLGLAEIQIVNDNGSILLSNVGWSLQAGLTVSDIDRLIAELRK